LLLFGVWKARLGSPFQFKMELEGWIWPTGQPRFGMKHVQAQMATYL
jgi:hypothetical protein